MEELLNNPLVGQAPIVALVIWLFTRFRQYENESRARWFAYMAERDDKLNATLLEFSSGNKAVATEIKSLGQVITRLDARLKG